MLLSIFPLHIKIVKSTTLKWFYIVLCFLFFNSLTAQEELNSDELFAAAKKEAFEFEDYKKAIRLIKIAIEKTPEYTDLKVFLGRLYAWSDEPKKAREVFKETLRKSPFYEDAVIAYANLEFWNQNYVESLAIVNEGLKEHPRAEKLQTIKAKVLISLRKNKEAKLLLNSIIKNNPNASEAKELLRQLKENTTFNEIEASYNHVYFEKRYDNPWHLGSIAYTRKTHLGPFTARFNYANRFAKESLQFQIDAYPKISKTLYAYVNGGVSSNSGIFPEYRAGISIYAKFLVSFEIDGGFRYLHFSNDTWIYTFSVGKYYKNFWFNFRTYLTPSDEGISNAYFLTTRYYYDSADDYISLQLGRGVSPDNSTNNVLISQAFKITSNRVFLEYRKALKGSNIFYLQTAFENVEYLENVRSNQYMFGLGYIKRF